MPVAGSDFEYRPFPNAEARNRRQESIEVPLFLSILGVPRGARVLEIGCGRGIALAPIVQQRAPARLVGLDVDQGLLDEAAGHVAGLPVELICGDVRALPFPDASFDAVIDFGTTYHIGRPLDALREISRVLAPGGRFCHETPLAQALSHPVRWGGRTLPWSEVPELRHGRRAVLWSCRRRASR
jgi:ubiquinone/menaquinone biosynthesis C-methylase UbiE